MKIQVSRIDANGYYVEPVLVDKDYFETYTSQGRTMMGDDIVLVEVPEGFHLPKWDGTQWVEGKTEEDILKMVKDAKITELDNKCNEAILGVFTSSTMGEPHEYVFDYEAQMNLAGTKQAFESGLITSVDWNTRDAGVIAHDATQFNQLWLDGFQHKISNINKFRALKEQVLVALTKAEVDAIVW